VLALRVLEGDRQAKINAASRGPVPEQTRPRGSQRVQRCPASALGSHGRNADQDRLPVYRTDSGRLVSYVYAEWTAQEFRRINETGLLVRGSNGEPRANPLSRVQERGDARATALGREFGIMPAARSRLLP
jgi:hypothetical protein